MTSSTLSSSNQSLYEIQVYASSFIAVVLRFYFAVNFSQCQFPGRHSSVTELSIGTKMFLIPIVLESVSEWMVSKLLWQPSLIMIKLLGTANWYLLLFWKKYNSTWNVYFIRSYRDDQMAWFISIEPGWNTKIGLVWVLRFRILDRFVILFWVSMPCFTMEIFIKTWVVL